MEYCDPAMVRTSSETTPDPKSAKKGKTNSTAPEEKEDRGQVIEFRQLLRKSKADLEVALSRVKRLKVNEDLQKKAYNDSKKKNDEELDGYDELRNLKLATFDHFLAKWENYGRMQTKTSPRGRSAN